MTVHRDFSTPGLQLPPVAERVGPFVHGPFLATWAAHRATEGEIDLVDGGDGLVALYRTEDAVEFAGEPDLTDYHSPLGLSTQDLIAAYVAELPEGVGLELDSLPREAAEVVIAGVEGAGLEPAVAQHEIAAVLDLPGEWEAFLAALSKKQRHEVRRKARRFAESFGAPTLERVAGPDRVAWFADMHRRAFGEKGDFMTDDLERFFADLHADVGAVIDVATTGDGEAAAAAFGFEDQETYYLYNSAYDPQFATASPGIVLIELLIRTLIRRGKTRLDFLKGDEPYKTRLGAVARPLYRVTAVAGGGS